MGLVEDPDRFKESESYVPSTGPTSVGRFLKNCCWLFRNCSRRSTIRQEVAMSSHRRWEEFEKTNKMSTNLLASTLKISRLITNKLEVMGITDMGILAFSHQFRATSSHLTAGLLVMSFF